MRRSAPWLDSAPSTASATQSSTPPAASIGLPPPPFPAASALSATAAAERITQRRRSGNRLCCTGGTNLRGAWLGAAEPLSPAVPPIRHLRRSIVRNLDQVLVIQVSTRGGGRNGATSSE